MLGIQGLSAPNSGILFNCMKSIYILPKISTLSRWSKEEAACWVLNHFNCKDSVTKMLSALKWKTLESRRTIARLPMLYKMRNKLGFCEDIKLQPVDHLYSTCSKEYAYKQLIATRDNLLYVLFLSKDNFRMEQSPKGNCIVQVTGCI